jgi:hypothetical protein
VFLSLCKTHFLVLHLFFAEFLTPSPRYFVEAGAMAVRRVKKEDLKRIAKATGATMVSSFHTVARCAHSSVSHT